MEQSVHVVFIISTVCIAGVLMVLAGFVLQLLLDILNRHDSDALTKGPAIWKE